MNTEHLSFPTPDALALAAADAWLDEIEAAARTGQPYCVALSGGRIAQNFFAATVARAAARKTSFAHVHFFWADERCVPPTDPASNYRMALKSNCRKLQATLLPSRKPRRLLKKG